VEIQVVQQAEAVHARHSHQDPVHFLQEAETVLIEKIKMV
jgi:hypothetical protein